MKDAELERILALVDQQKDDWGIRAATKNSQDIISTQNLITTPSSADALVEIAAAINNILKVPATVEKNETLYTEMGERVVDQDGDGDVDKNDQAIQQGQAGLSTPEEIPAPVYSAPIGAGMFSAIMNTVVSIANESIANNNAKLAEVLEAPELQGRIVAKDGQSEQQAKEAVQKAFNDTMVAGYEQMLKNFDEAITSDKIDKLIDSYQKEVGKLEPEQIAIMRNYWKGASEEERTWIIAGATERADECHDEEIAGMEENAEVNMAYCEANGICTADFEKARVARDFDYDAVAKFKELLLERAGTTEKQLSDIMSNIQYDEQKAKEQTQATDATTPSIEAALQKRTRTDSYIKF